MDGCRHTFPYTEVIEGCRKMQELWLDDKETHSRDNRMRASKRMRIAKVLGLTIPLALVARAKKVIQ